MDLIAWCAGIGMFVVLCLIRILARQLERAARGKSQRHRKT